MAASSEELLAADLALRPLVRRLCSCVLGADHFLAEQRQQAVSQLEDTAWSVLLGIHPDAAAPHVPPDERRGLAAAGLAAAGAALQDDGYPSLARDLGSAVDKLRSCATCPLLGSLTEAETGAVLELPLREHTELLSFLLSLRGSQPSLRQQRFTFQLGAGQLPALPPLAAAADPTIAGGAGGSWSSEAAGQQAAAVAPPTPPPRLAGPGPASGPVLTSRVFEEAPDPHALTDGSSAVAVLLPSEAGLPAQAFAGSEEVQDLAAGLGSRPVWDPASSAALPPLRSAAWLPVPASLAELRGDARRGARPAPLGLPMSLLSMGDEPGSCTLFSAAADEGWGSDGEADAASADSVQPVLGAESGRRSGGAAGTAGMAPATISVDLLVKLWSLQEAELAQHALLALQGVAASLRRLQALLAAPDALPRRSLAPLLQRLAAAGELRRRLQNFVVAFTLGSAAAAPVGGSARIAHGEALSGLVPDSVQHAFAVAVEEVLRRQSAALQQLELQQGTAWVQTVAVGGTQGRQLHSRGPTLLQVALHSGGLQLQLRRLAELCWCTDSWQTSCLDQAGDEREQGGLDSSCRWQDGGFPAGTELLAYLYSRASEADSADAPMLRFLFVQALQPYLRHLHSWAFTTNAVNPEFGTAGGKELLTLEFLPPEERKVEPLVPVDPPAFLRQLHAAFMRAGSQLRLLHSLEPQGRQLALQLAGIAEQEAAARWRQQHSQQASALAGAAPAHTVTSFAALPGVAGGVEGGEEQPHEAQRECWLSLAGGAAATAVAEAADGSQDLELASSSLPQAVRISEEQDSARAAAVDGWLAQMALQRRLAEHALAAEHDSRAAAQREQQAQRAAQQAAALSRQQSAKAALLQGQRAAVREQRAQRAAQQGQQQAADQQEQLLAARREHAAAVAELEQALGMASLGSGLPTLQDPALDSAAGAGVPAAAAGASAPEPTAASPQDVPQAAAAAPGSPSGRQDAQQDEAARAGQGALQDVQQPAAAAAGQDAAAVAQQRLPPGLPTLKLNRVRLQEHRQERPGSQPAGSAALPAGSARQLLRPGPLGLPAPAALPASSRSLFAIPPPLHTARGIAAWQVEAAAAAAHEGADNGGEEEEGPGALAPLSAVLECCVSQSVLSQYRAVSRACVRLFLDELKVLDHLEALRRFFFMGAGDWADALVAQLSVHADALAPVSAHQLEAALAEAIRGSSVESDPHAAHLRIRLLPASTSAITAQLTALQIGAISVSTPQRRPRSFWNTSTTVTLAPTQLGALDCICLDYRVGWPLSAILPEDTLQGYAAVFSMLVRVRRVEQLLRGLHRPLACQPKSTADLLLSEEDEDRAHRRIQRLRAFRSAAAQFVAALQSFLHARATGDAWVHLLAKLMVSSEEVAATLISREPSTAMTGLLSRMDSVGPAGKAAHKLAQQMSRALSASQPGSPAAAVAGSRGQLARFNSLLSAASAASSAANSAATSPRQGPPLTARQLSRFAGASSSARGGPAPPAAAATSAAAEAAGGANGAPAHAKQRPENSAGDASPTAATVGGGQLSRMTSFGSVLLGQAAAESGSVTGPQGAGRAAAAGGLDAAAWARSFQQSQQGIADLQELLDLHRSYVRQASEDCLTFGGSPEVQAALAGALQCLLDFAFRLRGAVQRGAATRAEEAWTQALRLEDTWRPLSGAMADFEARVQQLLVLLRAASGHSGLVELALQLDFNGFYSRRQEEARERRQRERWRHVAAAGGGAKSTST